MDVIPAEGSIRVEREDGWSATYHVGDPVEVSGVQGQILALHSPFAWVQMPDGSVPRTVHVAALRPLP